MFDVPRRIDALRTAPTIHDRWWLLTPLPFLLVAVQAAVLLAVPGTVVPSPTASVLVVRALTVAFAVCFVAGVVGLYFDLRYVREEADTDWRPSYWYGLAFVLPGVGVALLAYYLVRRLRDVDR